MKTTFPIFLLSIAALTSVSPAAGQSTLPKGGVVAFLGLKITHVVQMVPVSSAEGNPPCATGQPMVMCRKRCRSAQGHPWSQE
jgi:hypothetical protein